MSLPASATRSEHPSEVVLAELLEELANRVQADDQAAVEEFLRAHAKHADRLRRLLPAAQVLAELERSGQAAVPLAADSAEPVEGVLGDFRIIREIGRGGMGVVYEAIQISLKRRVALKLLPFVASLDARQLHRFRNEAQAAGQLHHSNIVPVHFVGVERGVHFYAMQYIEGRPLASHIRELRRENRQEEHCEPREQSPLSPHSAATLAQAGLSTEPSTKAPAYFRTVANLGVQAAQALDHAHQVGVIHRDIKPANLMLDVRGHLWVADFGLARCQNDAGLTLTGDLLGTLRYMSPEQALGQHALVDHQTDIYSLGVTLYELLTLEPAFPGTDRQEVLHRVASEEPRAIRRLNPAVPRELETIVQKAMEKSPADRYATAQDLADDLARFLDDRPIRARRPTLAQRLAKWARRHRTLVAAAVAFLMLAVVGLAVGTVLLAREQAETARARDLAVERERSLQQVLCTQDIGLAWQAFQTGELAQMRGLLDRHLPEAGQEDLRGFEWYYLRRRSQGILREAAQVAAHHGDAYCVAYAPGGRMLASAGKDGMIRLWDPSTLQRLASWKGNQGEINEVAFAPDSKTLASAGDDGTVRLWTLPDGRQRAFLRPPGRRDEINALTFSPSGKIVAAGGAAGAVWTWAPATAVLRTGRALHAGSVHYLAFAPDGRALAVANDQDAVRLLEPDTLRDIGELHCNFGPIESLAFSRDSRTLATGSGWGGGIGLWDLKTRTERFILRGYPGQPAKSLAFSPDDSLLAAAWNDGRVTLWDSRSGSLQDSLIGHDDRIWCTAFAPDGKRLATAGGDGIVKLWNVCRDDRRTFVALAGAPDSVCVRWASFTPDGRTLLTWATGELRRWDALSGQPAPSREPTSSAIAPALSPDGHLVTVTIGRDQQCDLQVWDLSGGPARTCRLRAYPTALAISPDGKQVAFGDRSLEFWLWEAGSARTRKLDSLSGICQCLAFAPDGRTVAVGQSARILLVEVATGRTTVLLSGHTKEVLGLAFSPDGRLLASASGDRTVRIWCAATGREQTCHWQHRKAVYQVAFSPDGKTLASGGGDRRVILWSVAQGQELISLGDLANGVTAVAFSPDSKILAAGGDGFQPRTAEVTLWYGEGADVGSAP